jgi:epoxyqueuosine reductase
MIKKIFQKIKENGFQYALVSVEHLKDIQLELDILYEQGLFDEEFYHERLPHYNFNYEEIFPEAKSVIIVAIPDPQYNVIFDFKGEKISLRVPPTYMYYDIVKKQMQELLNSVLNQEGFRVVKAHLPCKSLSAHSGLSKYGKNNITYIPSMGSFHILAAFYTDLPCEEENWREHELVETCERCSACVKKCPTGAISSKRFLLFAEKCLSYLNEKPGTEPFPDWIDPSWHNCLVGCVVCQIVCPLNKEYRDWIQRGPEFDEEETKQFLQGVTFEELSSSTKEKLIESELIDYLDAFPRNLSVLIRNENKNHD